jgi:hypothetical protein
MTAVVVLLLLLGHIGSMEPTRNGPVNPPGAARGGARGGPGPGRASAGAPSARGRLPLGLRLRGGARGDQARGEVRTASRARRDAASRLAAPGSSDGDPESRPDDVGVDERGGGEPPESAQDSSSGRAVGWEAVGAGVRDARELLRLPKKRDWTNGGQSATSKARRRGGSDGEDTDSHPQPPSAGAGSGDAQGEGAEAGRDQDSGELGLGDSGGGGSTGDVLDVDWDPAKEDTLLPPDAAGRRVITEGLLQRLIAEAGLPLQIEPQYDDDPDPLERFGDCPKVFLVGPAQAARKLASRLPRGFGVEQLNATLSILGRAVSPPPLGGDNSDQDLDGGPLGEEQERWLQSDGEEGTRLDEAYAAGNATLHQYRDAMVPRLLKLRRRTEVDDANGAFELGMRLLHGMGVRKDPINGCRYVMNAAAQGHCFAQAQLGNCYHTGAGVSRDDAKAAKWWKLAAAGNEVVPEGVLVAKHNLAVAYAQGIGVKRDYLLACHWHKQVICVVNW